MLSFANQKGIVGKTATTGNFSHTVEVGEHGSHSITDMNYIHIFVIGYELEPRHFFPLL